MFNKEEGSYVVEKQSYSLLRFNGIEEVRTEENTG